MRSGFEAHVRVLIVHEDLDSARRIRDTLAALDYHVVGLAGTAEEAMAMAVRETPDLALVGARMEPSRGGAEVSNVLSQTMGIPVVRLADESDPLMEGVLKDSSYFGYVTRPFDGPALRAAIEVALYRHRLEALLRASEGQFKSILQSTAEAVVATDARGILTFANHAAEELLGREARSLVGRDASEAVELVSDLARLSRHPVHEVLAVGRGFLLPVGTTVRDADGALRPVGGSVSVIESTGGRIDGTVIVLTRVPDEPIEPARATPAEGREGYRTGQRTRVNGDLWVRFVLDREGLIQECSNSFAQLLGVGSGEGMHGRTFREFLPVTVEYEYLAAQVKAAGAVAPHERVLRRLDGARLTVVMALRVTEEDPGIALARVMDVSGSRQLREQWEAIRRMEAVGRTAGGLGHTLDDIFQIIRSTAEHMAPDVDRPSRQDLSTITEVADRGAAIVHDLLAVGQRHPTSAEPTEVGEMLRSMLPELADRAGPRVLTALQLADEPLWVDADPALMRHALSRLVDNARQAMPEGGRVVFTLGTDLALPLDADPDAGHAPREYVTLSLADSGEGMDDAIRELAPDPFFSTRTDGLGLGLSVAFGLARQHGGWLSLESSPGSGTTVMVYLPRRTAPQERPTPEEP
ncbi:MAG: ATP-binding protein [Gemmatimonadota bacterium]|jgi:PAS domain S-box-containing protein